MSAPRRDWSSWRAISLLTVYVLGAIHVLHWKWAGTTLAPVELNEAMYTLEKSVLTAGFVLMALIVLSVLFFGRFFCSWGCHVLALQDGCSWLLQRIGIRPKPVRSRLMLLVPLLAMAYMFIWPQVERIAEGSAFPPLRVLTDKEGLGSFFTSDLWRNLPGPWMTLTTFVVCGGVMVWILGSRSFCTYVCPYGAVFAVADRFSPGRIRATDLEQASDCITCGKCTAACSSHIRVHEEVARFGAVVSPACLKDLDCVAACPEGKLQFGYTKPSLLRSWRKFGRFGVPYDYSVWEELLMAGVFLASLFTLRGLYGLIPFFLALALGVILAVMAVACARLGRRAGVRFASVQLSLGERITGAGWVFVGVTSVSLILLLHSAAVRLHETEGMRMYRQAQVGDATAVDSAIRHLAAVERLGLVASPLVAQRLEELRQWKAALALRSP